MQGKTSRKMDKASNDAGIRWIDWFMEKTEEIGFKKEKRRYKRLFFSHGLLQTDASSVPGIFLTESLECSLDFVFTLTSCLSSLSIRRSIAA